MIHVPEGPIRDALFERRKEKTKDATVHFKPYSRFGERC